MKTHKQFDLPDFYMPYPARLNPHLETARVNSKAWAYAMGILGEDDNGEPALWEERRFDAMDFAAFVAITHPDTPSHELDLLSEWYIWGWFVDDYFPKIFEMGGDLAGAREYVARILAFLPMDLEAPVPEPQNPVERALVDLWPRTAPSMSTSWRERYVGHLTSMAQAYLHEFAGGQKNRVLIFDPIEYIAVRRKVGGVLWSTDLVEHSLGAEIPVELYPTRPIRVIIDTFADVVSLRNDIISYPIDVSEGRVNNGVMAMEHFLGCPIERAVEVVNDLVTSRHLQFEHTTATELRSLFSERQVSLPAQEHVLRFVKALADWMAGDLEWELRPGGRYVPAEAQERRTLGPKGVGTAAARLGLSRSTLGLRLRTHAFVPYQPTEPFAPSNIEFPLAAAVHPSLETARQTSKTWARAMGMLMLAPRMSAPVDVWDEEMFDGNDAALSMALSYPDVADAMLLLITDVTVWRLYLNDYSTLCYGYPRDLAGAKVFFTRLLQFVPPHPGLPMPIPLNPVERGLADLWMRFSPFMSDKLYHTVRAGFVEYLEAMFLDLVRRIEHRISDPIDYLEMRRRTYGAELLGIFIGLAPDTAIAPEIDTSAPISELKRCAADICGLINDLVSCRKEVEFEGKPSNSVLVTERLLGCDRAGAIDAVVRMLHARIDRLKDIIGTELPALMDEHTLDEAGRQRLARYARRFERMAGGQVEYNMTVARYSEQQARKMSPLYRVLRGGPKGYGTSAMHITNSQPGMDTSTPASPSDHNTPPWLGPTGLGTSGLKLAVLLRDPPDAVTSALPNAAAAEDTAQPV